MIDVDSAVGSADLVDLLCAAGLPARLAHMESADVAFVSKGGLRIGIEVKKIGELVTSLQTERLQGHQLLKMVKHYDRRYMIVEGDFTHDKRGRGVIRGRFLITRGIPNAMALEQRLFNLQTRAGLIIRNVWERADTVRVIGAWYRYWTEKDLEAHTSHLALYAPDFDARLGEEVSTLRDMVARIPGVGFEMSQAIEEYYGGLRRLLDSNIEELAEIMTRDSKGKYRRIGPARAAKIWEAIPR